MTRADEAHPLRRVVSTTDGEFVVEVLKHEIRLRPLRTKRGGPAEIQVPWGAIYYRAMLARAEDKIRSKRKGKVRRVSRRHL